MEMIITAINTVINTTAKHLKHYTQIMTPQAWKSGTDIRKTIKITIEKVLKTTEDTIEIKSEDKVTSMKCKPLDSLKIKQSYHLEKAKKVLLNLKSYKRYLMLCKNIKYQKIRNRMKGE